MKKSKLTNRADGFPNRSVSLRIRIEEPESLHEGYAFIRARPGNENLTDEQCKDMIFSLRKVAGILIDYILANRLIINGMEFESEEPEHQRIAA